MWTRTTYDEIARHLPFKLEVIWDKAPSREKYGHVNSLLLSLAVLLDHGIRLTDLDGKPINTLTIAPLRRKITDRHKKKFSIIGLPGVAPLIMAEHGALSYEVYFNHHFFYQTETTYRQYYPGTSLVIRPRNYLVGSLVPSPGSWGSDITSLNWDWGGSFIIEAWPHGIPSYARKNFRGFKYLPSPYKIYLCEDCLPIPEARFIRNNGFKICVSAEEESMQKAYLKNRLDEYIREQQKRAT